MKRLVLFIMIMCFEFSASAERDYYGGFNADDKKQKTLDGFALYYDNVNKNYSILGMREYSIEGDVHVYPGRLKGTFTEDANGVLTSKNLVMRFYADYYNESPVCDVPISMTLTWNKDRTVLQGENVVIPLRYPKVYFIFGCEKLKKSDMAAPVSLSFTRIH